MNKILILSILWFSICFSSDSTNITFTGDEEHSDTLFEVDEIIYRDSTGAERIIKVKKRRSSLSKRSKPDIMKIVLRNLPFLKEEYNKRLKFTPDLEGRITVKIIVHGSGKVQSCEIVESTIPDDKLKRDVVKMILKWDFGKIDNQDDLTEVIYPFIFEISTIGPPIVNCENCKKGIYKSFEEFKNNNPSGKKDFFIETGADYYAMEPSKVKYLNQRGRKRIYNEKGTWGLCDSLNIYVYYRGKYCLLTVYPLYSFLLYSGTLYIPPTILGPGPGHGISIPIKYDIDYALDMKTGEIFKLKNFSLKNILEDDPELLQRFENDDKKKERRLQYLVEYNRRNASKANE